MLCYIVADVFISPTSQADQPAVNTKLKTSSTSHFQFTIRIQFCNMYIYIYEYSLIPSYKKTIYIIIYIKLYILYIININIDKIIDI